MVDTVDRGEALGLTLHIAKLIASEAKAEDAMRRTEEAASAEEFRPLLKEVTVGMSPEKQDDYIAFVEEAGWDDYKRRILSAAEKNRVDQMSPGS